jgi:hypothetical protein
MKRPARSRFMGQTYRVAFESPDKVVNDEGSACYGTTEHDANRIQVCDNLGHDKERDTVLHECLHQILTLGGLGLEDEVEERLCTFLGTALIGHMRDNPGIWRYLNQRPPKDTQ